MMICRVGDGAVREHAFERGDVLVFVSHKPHYVAPVTKGVRKVLIIELWEGATNGVDRFK